MSEHPERREIIKKHSAAIHIQNNITLLQRRAWNVLLYHAYDELPHHERHHVSIQVLIDQLEFDSKNEAYLKEALEALVGCRVKWNVLEKDGEWEWGVTTLLAEAKIKGGVCTYAYGPTLRERLYSPTMYAKIDLSIQNQFDSKHAQALWEICVDYLHEARGAGETPFIPLAKFRELMGIHEVQYPLFKEFNRRVIKEPVEEINRVTDFHVEVAFKRESRKVAAVKFRVRREKALPGYDDRQERLFPPEFKDMPEVVCILKETGLSPEDAWKIFQQQWDYLDKERPLANPGEDPETAFTRYIREKIHLLTIQDPSKVKNRMGWLLRAIKQNYSNPAFAKEEKRQAESRSAHAAEVRDRQRKILEEKKVILERDRDEAIHAICLPILDGRPELLEEMVQEILEEEPHYERLYERHLTVSENYKAHRFLRLLVDEQLMKRFPKRFKSMHDSFKNTLAQLDQ